MIPGIHCIAPLKLTLYSLLFESMLLLHEKDKSIMRYLNQGDPVEPIEILDQRELRAAA